MDDCKGVCYELATQDSSERLAHGFGRAFLGLLGWTQAALVFACIALAFGTSAPKAYALSAKSSPEMVIDGNFVGDNEGSKGYMCAYCSPYTATLELIGHYGDLIQIDQEKYAWLVGGDNPFSAAMDRWQELTGASNEEPTNSWLGDDSFIDGWLILSGKGNTWFGTFTDRQIQMAEIAFNSIMGGGTGEEGGGSGGGEITGDVTINGVEYKVFDTVDVPEGLTQYPRTTAGALIGVPYLNALSAYCESLGVTNANLFIGICDASWSHFTLAVCGAKPEFGMFDGPSYKWVAWPDFPNATDVSSIGYFYEGRSLAKTTYNDKKYVIYNPAVSNASRIQRSVGVLDGCRPVYSYYYGGLDGSGDGGDPEPPDVPAPEPPKEKPDVDAPTPPKLPDPKDPIVPRQPTKPDTPTIDPHIDLPDITVVTQPTNTTPEDYTPWLRAIFEELKALHEDLGDWLQDIVDEMANHCQHLRDEMSVQATYLGECLESVQDEIQNAAISLSNSLGDYSEWLADYLDQWGEWLVEHISWNNEVNVDPYDDTSLMYWIRRIYTKLGGSNNPVNTRPTDPVTNPNDTGNWLNELWETILKELAHLFPNLMIDLGLIFDDLKSKFPFSIPWDIHALLLLLVTEPVAPHFTIPMYALSTSYELEVVGEYDIDLSIYTDYLMGVHLMLEIAWIGYMLKHTKDYMELIEAVIPS